MHHMTFVRKDIRLKVHNSSNEYDKVKFVEYFDRYKLGDELRLPPDYLKRKTVLVTTFEGGWAYVNGVFTDDDTGGYAGFTFVTEFECTAMYLVATVGIQPNVA